MTVDEKLDLLLNTVNVVADDLISMKREITEIKSTMATKQDVTELHSKIDRNYILTEEFYAVQKECNTSAQQSLDTIEARYKMLETATVDNTKEIISLKRA